MYHYWTIQVLTGALVALALTELWFLRLREDNVEPDWELGRQLKADIEHIQVPEWLRRLSAERVVRSGW